MTSYLSVSAVIPHAALAKLQHAERKLYDNAATCLVKLFNDIAGGDNSPTVDSDGYRFACAGECSDSSAVAVEAGMEKVVMAAGATVYVSMEHDGDMSRWMGPRAEDKSNEDAVNSVMALFDSLPDAWRRQALERLAYSRPVEFKAAASSVQ